MPWPRGSALLDERAASGFAADETHRLQLRIDARRGDERESFARGKIAMRWQARAGRSRPRADIVRETVDDLFVARLGMANVSMTII